MTAAVARTLYRTGHLGMLDLHGHASALLLRCTRFLCYLALAMITVEVRFFGAEELFTRRMPATVLSELPRVRLPEGATVDDLLRVLHIPTGDGRPLVSVNRFYQRDNVALSDGDRVQLLRTVAGGAR